MDRLQLKIWCATGDGVGTADVFNLSEFIVTEYSVEIFKIFLSCNRIFGRGITDFVIATEYSNCRF